MKRPLTFLLRGIFALSLLAPAAMLTTAPVAASVKPATIAATTACSNGVDNTGGLGLICRITVVNTISATGGSATVTIHECHGAAGNPSAACTDTTASLTEPVTAVNQCNNSINGGGGTLRCSVVITNNYVDASPGATAATVNECVGSGGGITVGCDPFPATTSGAAITQCNGSANGGTLVGMTCAATGTMASAHAVTINQCNGSANGGGALVICSTSLSNNAVVASGRPATLPPTNTIATGSTNGSAPPFGLIGLWLLVGVLAVASTRRRGTAR
jgi:hypothetical protein